MPRGEMVGVWTHERLAFCFGLFAIAVLTSACSSPKPTPAPPGGPQLWGDITPVVSVKEVMRDMLDPASDFIFNAVGTRSTKNGTEEWEPKTDADWDKVRVGAVTLAEGVSLLKIPRPFAPPGDENNSTGPDAPELSPAQITAKLQADPVLWEAKIQALRNVGLEVLEIVKKKDAKAMWDASEDLDNACEACHLIYWYPGETALKRKLDKKLEGLYGPRPPRTVAPE